MFLGAVLSLGIVFALRRFFPYRRRLAMFLAVMFGPAGHLYLKGAARYLLLMYAAWIGLLVGTPLPPLVSALLLTVLSVMLMNVRLQKAAASEKQNSP